MIDFGPYPLSKYWLAKKVQIKASGQSQLESKKVFLPPDEENYHLHGTKNLVLKYED